MNNIRDLLSDLKWPCYTLLSDTPQVSKNIFTSDELSAYPTKWLKYLLLSKVGVQPISEIEQQIKRYEMVDYQKAQQLCHFLFDEAQINGKNTMVVLKVVPWNQAAQLKNFRIMNKNSIDEQFNRMLKEFQNSGYQIWCCQSSVDSQSLSMGGRITFPVSRLDQHIEIVWFASPRWLESVNLSNFEFPYIRGTKPIGNIKFEINIIHIPKTGRYINFNKTQLNQEFEWIIAKLSQRQKAIEALLEILFSIGAREVCLPFKVSEGELTIIDWDTEIESTNQIYLD